MTADDADRNRTGKLRIAVAISLGEVCNKCSGDKCYDRPDGHSPLEIECPVCDGKGCDACKRGWIIIDDCPKERVTHETMECMGAARWFEKGLPPVAGGVLDQCKAFTSAADFIWREQAAIKARHPTTTYA